MKIEDYRGGYFFTLTPGNYDSLGTHAFLDNTGHFRLSKERWKIYEKRKNSFRGKAAKNPIKTWLSLTLSATLMGTDTG